MVRHLVHTGLLAATLVIVSTAGTADAQGVAQPPTPGAAGITSSTHQFTEFVCGSPGNCTYQKTVEFPDGYGYDEADVFLAKYYIKALDKPQPLSRVKIEVTKVNYDPKGLFTVDLTAAFDGPDAGEFEFGVDVVILRYMKGYAVLTDPDPSDLFSWGDTSGTYPAGTATVDMDPWKYVANPLFTGFMIRGFEIEIPNNAIDNINEQLVDVSNYWVVNNSQASVAWQCGLTSLVTDKLTCLLNLVGVTLESKAVISSALRNNGPDIVGGYFGVSVDPHAQNWYAGLLGARASILSTPKSGYLELMSGGGTRQWGYQGWTWDAHVNGDAAGTELREVIMQEVQLY